MTAGGEPRLLLPIADGARPIRMLIVDDEPSICSALAMLFQSYGIDTRTAPGAASARAALADDRFDVLLIDLRMPDGRGDALFHDAAAREPGYRDRTIFMTGDISTEAERVIAATNCPYLRKPFDGTLAVQAIAALVGIELAPRDGTPASESPGSAFHEPGD